MDTGNPYIDSRFKKMTIPCPACDKPMGKRKGNEFWFLKPQRGKMTETKIDIAHDGNGQFRMGCECGGGHIFYEIKEGIGLNESIDVSKKSVE